MDEHREALATLIYAVDQREGWALVVGDPGVGKTTLIMALLREMGDRVLSAVVTNPKLTPMDFFNQLALELGLDGPFASKGPFLAAAGQLISRCRREGKAVLLVVDEAQDLSAEMLEELRLLSNLDNTAPRVLTIVLVGQPELVRVLKRAAARSLMQRLHRNYALKPLSPLATAEYVRRRLKVAGARQDIFDDQALEAIHEISGGVPRLINSVCDGALLQGFYNNLQGIGRQVVVQAAADDPSLGWQPSQEFLARAAAPASQVERQAPARPEPEAPSPPRPAPPSTLMAPEARRRQALRPQPPRVEERDEARDQDHETRRRTAPDRLPGLMSRLASGLSREAPGSLWKRLLVLILVLGLGWGGYAGLRKAWPHIRNRIGGPKIVIPAPVKENQSSGVKQPDGPPDWGPTLPGSSSGAQEK
jgi:general secretion pathway protein A